MNDLLPSLRKVVEELPRERLPEAAGALAEAQATLQLRLMENRGRNGQRRSAEERGSGSGRHLTAGEVGEMPGVSPKWAYDHAAELGAKKLSRRCVRFPEAGVRRYLAARRA